MKHIFSLLFNPKGHALKRIKIILTVISVVLAGIEVQAQGKLFIIGGGDRPVSLTQRMFDEAGITKSDYVVILPMASSEPDSAVIFSSDQYESMGYKRGVGFDSNSLKRQSALDSLSNAKLIFISGGDQARFMKEVLNTPIEIAIKKAFHKGGMVAGTSAGAAVMSKKMITGNELKQPESDSPFKTIEAGNVEVTQGLGLLDEGIIVDQHFVKRKRLNRLISVLLENPGKLCIGIDESTALLVKKNKAEVVGSSQIIVLRNKSKVKHTESGLLGAENIQLDVLLPGQKFNLK